jgi:hypothetical protein
VFGGQAKQRGLWLALRQLGANLDAGNRLGGGLQLAFRAQAGAARQVVHGECAYEHVAPRG